MINVKRMSISDAKPENISVFTHISFKTKMKQHSKFFKFRQQKNEYYVKIDVKIKI